MGKVITLAAVAFFVLISAWSVSHTREQEQRNREAIGQRAAEIIANKDATIRKLERVIATQRELLARCEGGF